MNIIIFTTKFDKRFLIAYVDEWCNWPSFHRLPSSFLQTNITKWFVSQILTHYRDHRLAIVSAVTRFRCQWPWLTIMLLLTDTVYILSIYLHSHYFEQQSVCRSRRLQQGSRLPPHAQFKQGNRRSKICPDTATWRTRRNTMPFFILRRWPHYVKIWCHSQKQWYITKTFCESLDGNCPECRTPKCRTGLRSQLGLELRLRLRFRVRIKVKPVWHLRGSRRSAFRRSDPTSFDMWFLRYKSGQTDRQTDRHADHNTFHCSQGWSDNMKYASRLLIETTQTNKT